MTSFVLHPWRECGNYAVDVFVSYDVGKTSWKWNRLLYENCLPRMDSRLLEVVVSKCKTIINPSRLVYQLQVAVRGRYMYGTLWWSAFKAFVFQYDKWKQDSFMRKSATDCYKKLLKILIVVIHLKFNYTDFLLH